MNRPLIFSTSTELIRILPGRVVYFQADEHYTMMMKVDNCVRLITKSLGDVENYLDSQFGSTAHFVRVGRSYIINCAYIHFIDVNKKRLDLSDGATFIHTLNVSSDALRLLKELVEVEGY